MSDCKSTHSPCTFFQSSPSSTSSPTNSLMALILPFPLMILAKIPSSVDSASSVALSVSTLNKTSPMPILSPFQLESVTCYHIPSFGFQATILPVSIVGLSAGNKSLMGGPTVLARLNLCIPLTRIVCNAEVLTE